MSPNKSLHNRGTVPPKQTEFQTELRNVSQSYIVTLETDLLTVFPNTAARWPVVVVFIDLLGFHYLPVSFYVPIRLTVSKNLLILQLESQYVRPCLPQLVRK
jgi:hypothetical protein